MNVTDVDLVMSAVDPKQYPKTGYPEIGFLGRSNVGKSSLTNVLINRRDYAHTSGQPGKTQTLNFYEVNYKLYFVDVPGYGYAKVSKTEREKWASMIETYLTQRDTLRGVISLIDGRHEPTEFDLQMRDWLEYYNIPVLYVATKVDKISKSKFKHQETILRNKLQLKPDEELVMFSAKTKVGKDQIWNWIENKIKA
ncbi:YihA family ribosome biogenesis GTP-binding protein [Lactobacillus sanfranciscensis]|uniref:Probable GTP-binding protein EngB n=1 Tax=Fructilactobacillus sanfranciscensis (strain TMW 1.1304) TaxID=714313 RepID=G2KWG9_FRUST|nr:ribosome biogenesis GTP-binding protein YihA/YsxC [Fructilactobacillus sanfranciscensis]AEN99363.1 putative GTP-binding protein engB [Fructilactobacillus sanfranciscensis TMW 1.1304]NDR75417.1 YihA family ribosome biogenesis GTP-binding protein [Fructilactobacillus sanfranciscensis]NDR96007.1 YihA family ribosome biogenesis GTP-binding protein [Fructilactobacillus sanfranciscensis]NDS03874.1 YihA family ribosome biogenesis GTP-binding protein [Fructilactobacillus sanfranciscensis]POH20345.1